jgi:hypothetical protein
MGLPVVQALLPSAVLVRIAFKRLWKDLLGWFIKKNIYVTLYYITLQSYPRALSDALDPDTAI